MFASCLKSYYAKSIAIGFSKAFISWNLNSSLLFLIFAPVIMDKTFLLKIDQDLQKVHFPAIEKYPQEERELISKILKNLKNIHYKKLSQNLEYNRFEMEDMYVFEKDQETRHYLDKLMKEGFFSYWDIYVNHQNKAIVSIVLYGNF